jgi:hypothetical protein
MAYLPLRAWLHERYYGNLESNVPCKHAPEIKFRFVLWPGGHALVRADKLSTYDHKQGNQCIVTIYCGTCDIMYEAH